MAGPQDAAAAGGDRLRAGHADREQVIDTLKDAFTQGRLTGDELDARTGQALAARTYAELGAVTADIPGAPRLDGLRVLARRWPLAMAAVKSGGFLALAFVIAVSGNIIDNSDPNGTGPLCRHHHRCKKAEGWQLTEPEPGSLVWHTPSGRRYATTPPDMRA